MQQRGDCQGAWPEHALTGHGGAVAAFLSDSEATGAGHETAEFVPDQHSATRQIRVRSAVPYQWVADEDVTGNRCDSGVMDQARLDLLRSVFEAIETKDEGILGGLTDDVVIDASRRIVDPVEYVGHDGCGATRAS